MGLDSAGKDIPNGYLPRAGELPQPPKAEQSKKIEFSPKETERRSGFLHRLEFTKPDFFNINDPSKDVADEVKKFNKSNSELSQKYLLSTRETDNNTRTLQISQKNVTDGANITPATRHLVDIDFMGDGLTEICTNDLQATLEAMQALGLDKGKDFGLIRLIVGEKTRYVVMQTLEAQALKGNTGLAVIDKEPAQSKDIVKKTGTEVVLSQGEKSTPYNGKEIVPVSQSQKNEIIRVSDHEHTDQPKKEKKSLHFGVAAAVGGHKVQTTILNAAGKEVTVTRQSKEVLMQTAERFASSQMSEVATKRGEGLLPTFKTYVERFWRGTLTKGIHEKKEKFHGIEIMAAAGVETVLTAEFNAEIDKRAREKIDKERAAKTGGKFFGALRDFGNEFIGRERDLHREKVAITADLRAQYMSNPTDESNPIFALIQRDSLVRDALAENIMTSPVDFLHEGDKKTAEFKVDSDSIFGKFLREEVLLKIKDDVITESKKPGYNNKISGKLRTELDQNIQDFLFSDKFQEYRKTLSVEDQKRFENSLTYATNILSQAESNFIPLIRENADFMTTAAAADMDIWLTLGTAQLGPKGEIKAPSVYDKDRISNNQALFDRLREVRRNSKRQNAAGLYDDAELRKGAKRELILAAAHSVATSEMLWAGVGAVGGRLAMTAARGSVSWIPFIGAGLAGAVSGVKEFGASTEIRGQWLVEGAEGYDHPSGANAARSEAMRRFDYYRIDMGHRIQQLDFSIGELQKGNPPTEAQILQTIAYMADSQARIRLGDKGGYSLFTASKDSAGERGIFQAQETIHNKARVLALNKLQTLLDGDANKDLRAKIATAIGADPAKMTDSMNLIHTLATSQEIHLHTGTKVSAAFMAVMGKGEKLIIEEEQSIQARDKLFNEYRWLQGFKHGVATAAIAALFAEGASHYQDLHFDTIKKGFEEGPITLLDHTLPTHPTGLPDGSNAIFDPQTGELVGATTTHIPAGTHWEFDDKSHAFDLILDKGDVQTTLINDATFNSQHQMTMTASVIQDIQRNHLDVMSDPQAPIDWVSTDTMSTQGNEIGWDNVIKYKDLPDGSLDAYFNQNLHESFAANPPLGADGQPLEAIPYNGVTNALRYLTRSIELHKYADHSNVQFSDGLEHNLHTVSTIHGTEFVSAPQTEVLELTKMPDYLIGADGNRKVANLVIEAINQHDTGQEFSSEAHRVAWEISQKATEADVPTADELNIIDQYLEQGTTTTATPAVDQFVAYDTWITSTQDLVVQGQLSTPDLVSHTVWHPASLVIPALGGWGYVHPLEAVETKQESAPRQTPPPSPQPLPTLPGPTGSQPVLPAPDDQVESNINPPNLEQNNGAVNVKYFQGEIAAELVANMNEKSDVLSSIEADLSNENSVRNISSFMNDIANKHNLPVAYIVRDGRVRLLTRPPEIIEDNKSRVFFYNPETGKEDAMEMFYSTKATGPAAERLKHTVMFSDKANFPAMTAPLDRPITDHRTVQLYLTEAGYDLSKFTYPEATPFNPASTTLWQNDIIEAASFVAAVKAAQSAPPQPPPIPPTPVGEGGTRYVPQELAPGIDSSVRRSMLESIFPASVTTDAERQAWLVHENKTLGMTNFIDQERALLAKSGERNWSAENEKTNWLSSTEAAQIAGKYHIPMAFMMRNNHAFVLTKPPIKAVGGYELHYYDPFKDGEQTLVLSEAESQDRNNAIYYTQGNNVVPQKWQASDQNYDTAIQQLTDFGYDLTIPVIPGQEWLTEAKGKLTQEDGQNCTLWSIYHAAIAMAMKPGHNEFKDHGAAIWEQQLGFHLLQYEDVVELPQASAVDSMVDDALGNLTALENQASAENVDPDSKNRVTKMFKAAKDRLSKIGKKKDE